MHQLVSYCANLTNITSHLTTKSIMSGRNKGHSSKKKQNQSGDRGKWNRHLSGDTSQSNRSNDQPRRKVLVFHGNRQTGDLLLGRMSSFKKKASKRLNLELVAPDAPFLWESGDGNETDKFNNGENSAPLRTWWHRQGNEYIGLEQSIQLVENVWDEDFDGIIGFSQGARLAHLISLLNHSEKRFPSLKFIIFASGYGDVPLPTNFNADISKEAKIEIASLHIMGLTDRLIPVESSRALLSSYENPQVYEHGGGHHVPMQSAAMETYLSFISSAIDEFNNKPNENQNETFSETTVPQKPTKNTPLTIEEPDEEHAQAQQDECESMALIFPDEFALLSPSKPDESSEYGRKLSHPITYIIKLLPPSDQMEDRSLWPSDDNFALKVTYPPTYPDTLPLFSLSHDMNLLQFKIGQEKACLDAIQNAADAEIGMPCVMTCVYAAREFFEGGGLQSSIDFIPESIVVEEEGEDESSHSNVTGILLPSSSPERNLKCTLEGLDIANSLLGNVHHEHGKIPISEHIKTDVAGSNGRGGTWKYCIGLVGKPSAGKSTFFNAASAFARQRGAEADDELLGGATMAPHPFTTIDPNVGYCLVPAPPGACPEDDNKTFLNIGSTHGRDSQGRRLIPMMLKDVAGLVPGAYQGRGKGNKFLDDLTDADVLIHVIDASGSSDTEGNKVVLEEGSGGSHPLNDLNWIRNELLEWVYSNVSAKWESVLRKGTDKLLGMFSGYKQSQAFVWDVLLAVEKYLEQEGRSNALDRLSEWDEGDLRRLVSAFLGARFPMALALNKSDLPSAKQYVNDVKEALPIHGAHAGVALCAKKEMTFVRNCITNSPHEDCKGGPEGVWSALQKAIGLREPILVFPVIDMTTYDSLPGLDEYSISHSSLPSIGMLNCLKASGGTLPTCWNDVRKQYMINDTKKNKQADALRNTIIMKPGSTVEDVFVTLKYMGALGGEFVRAEGAGLIGDKPKLVKKDDLVGRNNRILHIMTNKKVCWQKKG